MTNIPRFKERGGRQEGSLVGTKSCNWCERTMSKKIMKCPHCKGDQVRIDDYCGICLLPVHPSNEKLTEVVLRKVRYFDEFGPDHYSRELNYFHRKCLTSNLFDGSSITLCCADCSARSTYVIRSLTCKGVPNTCHRCGNPAMESPEIDLKDCLCANCKYPIFKNRKRGPGGWFHDFCYAERNWSKEKIEKEKAILISKYVRIVRTQEKAKRDEAKAKLQEDRGRFLESVLLCATLLILLFIKVFGDLWGWRIF